MISEIKHHTGYYILLGGGLFLALLGVLLFRGNAQLQLMVAMLGTIFYIMTGIVHHHLSHTLSTKVVLEYILFGALGITILYFVL